MPVARLQDGLRLRVLVSPRASRSELSGLANFPDGRSALKIRVAAPPVDGAANAAIVLYLAKLLGVPKSAIRVEKGETSRAKTLRISGDPAHLLSRLKDYLA